MNNETKDLILKAALGNNITSWKCFRGILETWMLWLESDKDSLHWKRS